MSHLVSGQEKYVGGGSVRRAKLQPDEQVLKSGDARCRWRYWLTSWGTLFLAVRRCPKRPVSFVMAVRASGGAGAAL